VATFDFGSALLPVARSCGSGTTRKPTVRPRRSGSQKSKDEFEAELQLAIWGSGCADDAGGDRADSGIREIEVGAVEKIEGFGAEFEAAGSLIGSGKLRWTAKSMLLVPGPIRILRPELP
jgi:hypothetical protein